MKRSKIFLGITTCILAVVGVSVAKAHKFSNTALGFYSRGTGAGCTVAIGSANFTVNSGSATHTWKINSGATTVFSANASHACVHPLYTVSNGD